MVPLEPNPLFRFGVLDVNVGGNLRLEVGIFNEKYYLYQK